MALLKSRPLKPVDSSQFFRKTLMDRGAEPLITDDLPRQGGTSRTIAMNLREYGQVGTVDPWLNEVTLHDNTPDPRRTENIPRLEQIANIAYGMKSRISASLHSDGTRIKEIGGAMTQFEDVDRNMAIRECAQKRLIVFDTERTTYNPNKRTTQISNDPALVASESIHD